MLVKKETQAPGGNPLTFQKQTLALSIWSEHNLKEMYFLLSQNIIYHNY